MRGKCEAVDPRDSKLCEGELGHGGTHWNSRRGKVQREWADCFSVAPPDVSQEDDLPWMEVPDSPGFWWFCGGEMQKDSRRTWWLRGVYAVTQHHGLNDSVWYTSGEKFPSGSCQDEDMRIFPNDGLWRRVQPPELPRGVPS